MGSRRRRRSDNAGEIKIPCAPLRRGHGIIVTVRNPDRDLGRRRTSPLRYGFPGVYNMLLLLLRKPHARTASFERNESGNIVRVGTDVGAERSNAGGRDSSYENAFSFLARGLLELIKNERVFIRRELAFAVSSIVARTVFSRREYFLNKK